MNSLVLHALGKCHVSNAFGGVVHSSSLPVIEEMQVLCQKKCLCTEARRRREDGQFLDTFLRKLCLFEDKLQ